MMLRAKARTDVGRLRARNEDSFVVDEGASLYAIADGMGGHAAGDVASQTAVAVLATSFAETRDLGAAVHAANRAIFEKAAAEIGLNGMGTTMTAAHIAGTALHVAHVGDSRLYRYRDGVLTQITRDHTVAQDMIEQGALDKYLAMRHPLNSMLTRSLGLRADVDIDVLEDDVAPNDLLLLCSDGLTSMLTDEQVEAALRSSSELEEIADTLVAEANAADGMDNITVVVIRAE